MAGVLFIVNVPRKEYEAELNKDKTKKTVIEKDKYTKVSKLVDELKENKRFGSLKTSIESYAPSEESIVISKCNSTDCLHKYDKESSLYKSKSETNVNVHQRLVKDKKKSARSSWRELKQVINPRRSKLKITKPGSGVDILASFHWDTPLEIVKDLNDKESQSQKELFVILYEIIVRLDIKDATWNSAKNSKFWQGAIEDIRQVLGDEPTRETEQLSPRNMGRNMKLFFEPPILIASAVALFSMGGPKNNFIYRLMFLGESCSVSLVMFSLESGCQCEELLQVLRSFGVGSRHRSSVCVIPCALYYNSTLEEASSEDNGELASDKGAWSRFSSSVRSRTNLAQVLHDVRAEAALTFDWLFLLVVAAFVAAIGLVENSTVILVASMLISPLMGPITAGTLGTTVRDRSLQQMGVAHELLGLFLSLVIGFMFGLAICAVDERYGVGDWPTYEMMSRCEIRSLWVGIMVAIPSGAGVALAVLGDYTASLVGVAISASLLPPAVNAGLLWAMALVHLIFMDDDTRWTAVVKTTIYSDNQPTELAVLGAVSLCLTLVNILCIFLAGVAVYKVKEVCPLERRDISWWRANRNLLQSSKKKDKKENSTNPWDMYSKWRNDLEEKKAQDKRTSEIGLITQDTDNCKHNRPLTPLISSPEAETVMTITSPKKSLYIDNYVTLNVDTPGLFSYTDIEHDKSKEAATNHNSNSIEQKHPFYSFYEDVVDKIKNDQNELPTLEPSVNLTVDQKRIVLGSKSYDV